MKKVALVVFLFCAFTFMKSEAATVAIIDSGTDMQHESIANQSWINPIDSTINDRDEDGNGYQDDINGWNFAESNNEVIDYSYLGLLDREIERFFEVQAKMMTGEASEEDMAWLRERVSDSEFIKKLTVYGNFMHGTHVGAIAINDANKSKLLAIKLLPTEVKLPGDEKFFGGIKDRLIKFALGQLAKQQMVLLTEIADYVNGHKAEVANGSFGTGYAQARMLIKTISEGLGLNLTDEEIKKYSIHFLDELIKNGQDMVAQAPNTLFVFASGNDGSNNDLFPGSPTNIRADNSISVGATVGYDSLAPFSNYGKKTVDVVAPGYNIYSAVPGNKYLRVSGTSQAAPYVSNVALKIFEANDELSPSEVKKILIDTVDKREELKEKVLSEGVVNSIRAVRAANLSLKMPLVEAIASAQEEIGDRPIDKSNALPLLNNSYVVPLPSIFKF